MSEKKNADFEFGERVKLCSTRVGNSAVLARMTGISPSTINSYESGVTDPTRLKLIDIAKAANVSLIWLVTGDGHLDDACNQKIIDADLVQKAASAVREYGAHLDPDSFGEAVALAAEIGFKEGDINVSMIKKLVKIKGVV